MSKQNRQQQPTARSQLEWDEATPDEKEILHKVEELVVEQYKQHHATQSHSWSWLWTAPALAATAAFLFFFLPQRTMPPNYQVGGALKLKTIRTKGTAPVMAVRVPGVGQGRLKEKGKWELQAQGGSNFRWERHSKRDTRIHLSRGKLRVHVNPGTMKRFSVHCTRGTQVFVKGTIFAVEQYPDGLWVEVERGRVEVRRKSGKVLNIKSKQGVFVPDQGKAPTIYSLPSKHMRALPRLKWLLQRGEYARLARFARGESQRKMLSKQKRHLILFTASLMLDGAKQYPSAARLYYESYKQQAPSAGAETTLVHAATSCHKGKNNSTLCKEIFERYLARYSENALARQRVLFFNAHRLYRLGKYKQTKQQLLRLLALNPIGGITSQAKTLLSKLP